MQSRLLRSFLVVAEKSNITEASQALNVSQPALTKSIHRLEDELKVKLFDRITSGVRLTPYGEILLQHVRIMENEYRHAQSRIEALRDGHAGELRIGAGPVWLVDILPPLLAQFQSAHPGIKISLIGGVIDTLVPAVINGDLDVICVSLDFPSRSEVVKVPLIDINHVLVVDPSHPLLANTSDLEHGTANPDAPIIPGQLAGFPWLVLKSDYVGTERILSFHAANGLQPPTIALETTSIHSLMEMLHSGNYIAHIPSQLLSLARTKGLAELRINGTFWETTAGLVYRSSLGLTGDTRSFIQQMQRHDFNAIAREET